MGILQPRILEWVAMPSCRDLPNLEIKLGSPALQADFLPAEPPGKPKILEWVAYPFSSEPFWPRNQTRVSCIAGRFFTSWAKERLWKTRVWDLVVLESSASHVWYKVAYTKTHEMQNCNLVKSSRSNHGFTASYVHDVGKVASLYCASVFSTVWEHINSNYFISS